MDNDENNNSAGDEKNDAGDDNEDDNCYRFDQIA